MNKLKKIELIEEMVYLQNQMKSLVSRIDELELNELRITEKPKKHKKNGYHHNEDCPFTVGDIVKVKGTILKASVTKIYPSEGMIRVCFPRSMDHETYDYNDVSLVSRSR